MYVYLALQTVFWVVVILVANLVSTDEMPRVHHDEMTVGIKPLIWIGAGQIALALVAGIYYAL